MIGKSRTFGDDKRNRAQGESHDDGRIFAYDKDARNHNSQQHCTALSQAGVSATSSPRGSVGSSYSAKKRSRGRGPPGYTEDPRRKVQSKVRSHPWLDYEWGQQNRLKSNKRLRQRKRFRSPRDGAAEFTSKFAKLHLPTVNGVKKLGKTKGVPDTRKKIARESSKSKFRYKLFPVAQGNHFTRTKRRKKGNKIGNTVASMDAPLSSLPSIASRGELETIAARLQDNIDQPSESSPLDDEAWTKYKQSTYWPGRDPGRSRQCRKRKTGTLGDDNATDQYDPKLAERIKNKGQGKQAGAGLPKINANLGRDAAFLTAGREETKSAVCAAMYLICSA